METKKRNAKSGDGIVHSAINATPPAIEVSSEAVESSSESVA